MTYFNGRLSIEIASEKTNTKIPKQNEIKSTNLNQVIIDQNNYLNKFKRHNGNVKAPEV